MKPKIIPIYPKTPNVTFLIFSQFGIIKCFTTDIHHNIINRIKNTLIKIKTIVSFLLRVNNNKPHAASRT